MFNFFKKQENQDKKVNLKNHLKEDELSQSDLEMITATDARTDSQRDFERKLEKELKQKFNV